MLASPLLACQISRTQSMDETLIISSHSLVYLSSSSSFAAVLIVFLADTKESLGLALSLQGQVSIETSIRIDNLTFTGLHLHSKTSVVPLNLISDRRSAGGWKATPAACSSAVSDDLADRRDN